MNFSRKLVTTQEKIRQVNEELMKQTETSSRECLRKQIYLDGNISYEGWSLPLVFIKRFLICLGKKLTNAATISNSNIQVF